ncbi:MAG: 30S ribosomal protein S24e [Candidatus Bathyarchaeota archaeon]|jgi:small subunit ribosomal protein S24e|nr:30S ribosomal protein S24e [Candidatus Bathyarchaeota archaeon]
MNIKIISDKTNPLLKRREVEFQVEHTQTGSTPPRVEVRKALASALKADIDLVVIKKFETKTGTNAAVGIVNVYDSLEQLRLIEPEYIIKRNFPAEKPKEEEKG